MEKETQKKKDEEHDKTKAENHKKDLDIVLLDIDIHQFDPQQRKRCIIYPNDRYKIWWDVFLSLVLLISCFQAPLEIAFPYIFEA